LNQSEIETIARQLLAAGHEIVSDPAAADKVVVNTCAVTAKAAKDARKKTRRYHKQNAGAEIVLTGCYATIAPDELLKVPGAARVVHNKDKDRMLQILDPEARIGIPIYEQEPILRQFLASLKGKTRAFVKVQDGCDNRCTFCITTIARGESCSRPLPEIVAEVHALAVAGYKEAVLTGVHLGSYGRDLGDGHDLSNLVNAILADTDILRLRLSSLEPWDVPPDFFRLWENPRLLPHLHVPLQSGSDRILRRMARRTSRASFRELVSSARDQIPDLNLSTDLIVGFPGETEADFQDSLDFVATIGFSRLHVFPFSSRPGTVAAGMDGRLEARVKKARARRMIDLGYELSLAFHKQYQGRTAQVLWEMSTGTKDSSASNGGAITGGVRCLGYTDNYIRVTASGDTSLNNQVTTTHLYDARPDGMSGTIVRDAPRTQHR